MQAQPVSEENVFAAVEAKFRFLIAYTSTHAMTHDHTQIEQCLWDEGVELLRRFYQAHLDLRAQAEARREVMGADSVARNSVRTSTRHLETLFGTVTVRRLSYGAEGVESLRPADADLNLPERLYSAGIQQRVAKAAATEPFSQVVETIATSTAAQIPKRQAEQVAVEAACDFEGFYEAKPSAGFREVARTGSLLVISADGKGVVMRHDDLREATRRAAATRSHKRQTRLSSGEKPHSKRMATVATVYTVDRHERGPEQIVPAEHPVQPSQEPRPRPQDKRVWASLEREPEQVLREAFEEAQRRDPHHHKPWVGLVDGNKPQLEAIKALATEFAVKVVIVLDLIHVLEYLWRAVRAFYEAESSEAEGWVRARVLEILQGRSGHVAGLLLTWMKVKPLTAEAREALKDCAHYLINYGEYLHYDEYLAAGFPIATGVIEGACRHLIKDRMDVTGARWSLAGAEAVLKLRSLRSSGDFDAYWEFHQVKELERNHASRYANGCIPTPPSRKKPSGKAPHLRLVKDS